MKQRRGSDRSRRGRLLQCSNGAQYTVPSAAVKRAHLAAAGNWRFNLLFFMGYAALTAAEPAPSSASRSAATATAEASRTWPKPRIRSGSDASFTARS